MRQWLREVRGQSILEYSILVAMVAAAFVAMSMYVQRATQGRITQIDEAMTPKPEQTPTYRGWPAAAGAAGGGSSWPW